MGNASRTVFSAFAAIFVAIAWTTEPLAGDIWRSADMLLADDLNIVSCAQPAGGLAEIARPGIAPMDVHAPETTSTMGECSEDAKEGIRATLRFFCGPEGGMGLGGM